MKIIKNGLLVLTALFFVALGAAMPWLVSQIQDAQLSGFQKNSELNSVSLTLRQDVDSNSIPIFEMTAMPATESAWEGQTVLTQQDAQQAALEALDLLTSYGLPPSVLVRKIEGSADPVLLVFENGSSALVWWCTWQLEESVTSVMVDDSTGKAVRLVDAGEQPYDDVSMDSIYIRMNSWLNFLQDYYECFIEDVSEQNTAEIVFDDGHTQRLVEFTIGISMNERTEWYKLDLEVASNYTLFNCN